MNLHKTYISAYKFTADTKKKTTQVNVQMRSSKKPHTHTHSEGQLDRTGANADAVRCKPAAAEVMQILTFSLRLNKKCKS